MLTLALADCRQASLSGEECMGPSLAPVCVYVCLCVFIHGDVSREDLFVIQWYFCVLVTAGGTCLISLDFIYFSFDCILHSLRLFA